MEKIVDSNKCCGCYACFNACPKEAIVMCEDKKGFKYPIIDKNKCVNCGLCRKSCPILNSDETKKDIKAYACYNKLLEERINSSSGGVFVMLAKEILNRKGVVFGAKFNDKFEIIHSFCETEKELSNFMGSKYTQSTIGDSLKKVKEYLEKDRYVLFSGTPCQIEGLKSYLKKDYEKLYTQDIICHGVPSPKLWKKYLDYQEKFYKEKVRNVQFRNKDHGWSLYRTKISFDTRTYSEPFTNDLFMKAFLSNICLRDSCYECSFKKKYRNSDITLADYWGVTKVHPDFNDDYGISLVIVNSKKGKELFDIIKEQLVYKETGLDAALKYNSAMLNSSKKCVNEEKFVKQIDNMEIDELIKKYVPKPSIFNRCKTGIKNILKKIIK